ncbi:MAG: hypothetical protein HC845_02355 [Akkermansiaceae bacterium]|nr:hypothetical protein [Akkermansiaceae bacterium]
MAAHSPQAVPTKRCAFGTPPLWRSLGILLRGAALGKLVFSKDSHYLRGNPSEGSPFIFGGEAH